MNNLNAEQNLTHSTAASNALDFIPLQVRHTLYIQKRSSGAISVENANQSVNIRLHKT